MPENYVEVHAKDAKRLGINNGDRVRITSRRGKVELRAWVDGRGAPPEGSLFVPFFDEKQLVNLAPNHVFDPISKQPDYKKCAVKIERLGPA